jgi:hypothetical protein
VSGVFEVVQVGPLWRVMRRCDDWQTFGACRYELWCQCVHAAGGPLREAVFESVGEADAKRALVVLEKRERGVPGALECVESGRPSAKAWAAFLSIDEGDVLF